MFGGVLEGNGSTRLLADNAEFYKLRTVIHLDNETIEYLKGCNHLHIAVSDFFESRIVLQGTIEIDDVSKGKLLAYVEMDR